ncbi:hypothetical protein Tco_0759800, partial [Tanacetum coccineum]
MEDFEDFRRSPLEDKDTEDNILFYNDLHKNDDEVDELDDDDVNDDDQDDVNDDDKETDSERTESNKDEIPDPNEELTEHEKEEYNDQRMNEEEDDEVSKELYDDLDINLGIEDAEMKNADQGVSGQQNNTAGTEHSSFVSSDFTSKLLNLDNTPPHLDASSSQTSSLFTIPITTVPAITSATTLPPPP